MSWSIRYRNDAGRIARHRFDFDSIVVISGMSVGHIASQTRSWVIFEIPVSRYNTWWQWDKYSYTRTMHLYSIDRECQVYLVMDRKL